MQMSYYLFPESGIVYHVGWGEGKGWMGGGQELQKRGTWKNGDWQLLFMHPSPLHLFMSATQGRFIIGM